MENVEPRRSRETVVMTLGTGAVRWLYGPLMMGLAHVVWLLPLRPPTPRKLER